MNAIKDMLSEADGSFSLLRFVLLLVVLELVFEHTYILVTTGQPKQWNWEEFASLTALVAGKVGQKALEQPKATV
jgi:hypothetical protein